MKQLDIDVSPPTNIPIFSLILTSVTFDLDPCDPWPWLMWPLTMTKWPARQSNENLTYPFFTWWPWYLTLTCEVDLGVTNVHALVKFHDPRCNTFEIWIIVQSEFLSSDRRTDRQKAMYRSPLCTSTGGLKNLKRRTDRTLDPFY